MSALSGFHPRELLFPLLYQTTQALILPFPRGYWLPTLEEALIFSASVRLARFPKICWPKTADFIQFSGYLSPLWWRRRAQLSVRSHLYLSVCFSLSTRWTHIHFPGMGIIQINHYRVIVVCQRRAWRCDAGMSFSRSSLSFAILISFEAGVSLYIPAANVGIFYCHLHLSACMWSMQQFHASEKLCTLMGRIQFKYSDHIWHHMLKFNTFFPIWIFFALWWKFISRDVTFKCINLSSIWFNSTSAYGIF